MARLELQTFVTKDGRRLVLRHCAPADAPLFEPFQQQAASETTHTLQRVGTCPPLAAVGARWAEAELDPLILYVGAFEDGAPGRLVAQLGFYPENATHPWVRGNGHFGMMLLREYWGQGLGGQLLAVMERHARAQGFHRIEAKVRAANERGIALYRKAGFEIEGTRREAAFIDGSYRDELFIAKIL